MVNVNGTDVTLWNEVTPELRNGEELLWVGKPMPIRVILANGEVIGGLVGLAMIAVILVIFNSFRMPNFGSASTPFGFVQWFLIAFGLYSLGRLVYEFIMAGRTVYGLTDQRAIIIKPTLSGKKVESYPDSEQIERHDLADGKGDLIFHKERIVYRRRGGTRSRQRKIGFFGIDNVREVEALMLKTFGERTQ